MENGCGPEVTPRTHPTARSRPAVRGIDGSGIQRSAGSQHDGIDTGFTSGGDTGHTRRNGETDHDATNGTTIFRSRVATTLDDSDHSFQSEPELTAPNDEKHDASAGPPAAASSSSQPAVQPESDKAAALKARIIQWTRDNTARELRETALQKLGKTSLDQLSLGQILRLRNELAALQFTKKQEPLKTARKRK